MPDRPAGERTEQPTPERLKRAREEGMVPLTAEVPSALMIATMLILLVLLAPSLLGFLVNQVRSGLSFGPEATSDAAPFTAPLRTGAVQSLLALVPFLAGAAGVSVLGSILSSGWTVSPKALRINFERISPARGFKTLFSARSVVHLAVSVAKLVVVLLIVYVYLRDRLEECLALRHAHPAGVLTGIAGLALGLLWRLAVALVAIAVGDLVFQRWKYRRELRMTRQEVLEERKQHEISPYVRGRIRAVQIEMVRKRMLQAVPEADVVVTNPNHVAVALQYESASMDAPTVVAKGADHLCEKIKEIARAHRVPILYRPELARALYEAVDVGQVIPETLFVAVAEVLAMIYRLRQKRLPVGRTAKT